MATAILVINVGSSSLKFAIYRERGGDLILTGGGQAASGGGRVYFEAKDRAGTLLENES
jgi:acetate kinase